MVEHGHRGGNYLFFKALQLKNATKSGIFEKNTITFTVGRLTT
jgi:hypothetical protein